MTLTLAVDTSSLHYGVALSSEGHVLAHRTRRRDDALFSGVGDLAGALLHTARVKFVDLERLAVNVGPGNLGSVRAGVAYVNGLAFSLKLSVVCVDALSVLAAEAAGTARGPVLCLRNAGGGNVFAGLRAGHSVSVMRYGPMDVVIPQLANSLDVVSVAGMLRDHVPVLLPRTRVRDTGIAFSNVLTLAALTDDTSDIVDVATPLTDTSPHFHD